MRRDWRWRSTISASSVKSGDSNQSPVGYDVCSNGGRSIMADRSAAAKKAAQTKKHRAAGKKAAKTRKLRAAGKKAARTRKLSAAGKKAALTRKRRVAGRKAAATRKLKKEQSASVPAPPAPPTPQTEAQTGLVSESPQ